MHEIVMRQRFAAPPARVFELVTDHVGLGRWLGADIHLEHPGEPPPNGLGAIRVIRRAVSPFASGSPASSPRTRWTTA